jgi:hypothetical protein
MIIDQNTEMADASVLGGGLGRQLLSDVIDLGSIPDADGLYLVVQVDTTFLSGGAAAVAFEVVSDAQGAIAVDGSATQHFSTGPLALSRLIAGAMVACVQLPRRPVYERYLGVLANVGVAALTEGKVNVFLTPDPARWAAYADGVN